MSKHRPSEREIANLRPNGSDKLTPEEQLALCRKGQAAKTQKARERKSLREALEILLARPFTNKNGETASGIEVVAIGLFNKAKSGDTAAVRLLAELVGEAEAQGVTVIPQIVVPDKATADDVAAMMEEA